MPMAFKLKAYMGFSEKNSNTNGVSVLLFFRELLDFYLMEMVEYCVSPSASTSTK
jgi:hypothetical protein